MKNLEKEDWEESLEDLVSDACYSGDIESITRNETIIRQTIEKEKEKSFNEGQENGAKGNFFERIQIKTTYDIPTVIKEKFKREVIKEFKDALSENTKGMFIELGRQEMKEELIAEIPIEKNYFNRFKLSHSDNHFSERDGAMFDQGYNKAIEEIKKLIKEK